LGPHVRRVFPIARSKGLAAATGLPLVAAALLHALPAPEPTPVDRGPMVLFPRTVGDWVAGPPERLDADIERVLAADDYFGSNFTEDGTGLPVILFIAWYRRQVEGSGIHSPEVCIPAGGWEMSDIEAKNVSVQLASGESVVVPVNRAMIRKGLQRQLVYYWFEGRGRRLTNDYEAKALLIWDAATIGRTDGALVRLLTPLGSKEAESDGDERLKAFLADILPTLPRFVPDWDARGGQEDDADQTFRPRAVACLGGLDYRRFGCVRINGSRREFKGQNFANAPGAPIGAVRRQIGDKRGRACMKLSTG